MHDYRIFLIALVFLGPLAMIGFWAMRASESEYKRLKDSGRI